MASSLMGPLLPIRSIEQVEALEAVGVTCWDLYALLVDPQIREEFLEKTKPYRPKHVKV